MVRVQVPEVLTMCLQLPAKRYMLSYVALYSNVLLYVEPTPVRHQVQGSQSTRPLQPPKALDRAQESHFFRGFSVLQRSGLRPEDQLRGLGKGDTPLVNQADQR
jgi:hypothetical protein